MKLPALQKQNFIFTSMDNQPKLFMLLLGCKPYGRHTEQHDVFFTIASHISDTISSIENFWPEAKGNIHVDAWREVTNVDGHQVQIFDKETSNVSIADNETNQLFFINLGGYKKYEFEEFHYKMLAVAEEKGEAIRQSKQTAFYKHTGFKGSTGATSHVDDKYGVDVDDACKIEDILPADVKEKFSIRISGAKTEGSDEMNLGYFTLQKLAFFS